MSCNNITNSIICPYVIAVRQIYCQNGIPRTIENVYANILPNTEIPLQFGYILTYISGDNINANITLSNSLFIPNISFKIPSGSFKTFNVQAPNGSLKIYVGARIYCNAVT